MKKFFAAVGTLCVAVCLAVSAFAAEYGEPNITTQTTMKELRENPSIKGSGLYTYVYIWERDCDLLRHSKDNDTMEQVIGTESVNSCVAGMNYLIETYNAGTQITYKLFSPEEIAQDASRDRAELYYFPAEQPGAKYAVVLSGNALFYSGEMRGGVSTAWELHQQGYAVFALRYRIGLDATDNAPLEDLGRAIQFITANAQQFGVQTEDYALVGYSSGGQIAGIFGGKELGYPNYGVPKPGALLLAYPINNFWLAKPAYTALLDEAALPCSAGYRCAGTAVLRLQHFRLRGCGLPAHLLLVWSGRYPADRVQLLAAGPGAAQGAGNLWRAL